MDIPIELCSSTLTYHGNLVLSLSWSSTGLNLFVGLQNSVSSAMMCEVSYIDFTDYVFDQDEGNESKDVEENPEAAESSDSERPDACDGV